MYKVEPFLLFDGNCGDAINYYIELFNGKELKLMTYGDVAEKEGAPNCSKEWEGKIMFASFELSSGSRLLLADRHDNQELQQGNDMGISLDMSSEEEMRRLFEYFAQDGWVLIPIKHTFWNALYGAVVDKFEKKWYLNCQLHE